MTWTISTDQQGLIWAHAGPEYRGFNEAMADSISALSPRGVPPSLSTYWIDHAIARIHSASAKALGGGNATSLIRVGDEVIAHSDYELFEDERMSVAEFLNGLELWREAVQSAIDRGATISLTPGVTYWAQRNPY